MADILIRMEMPKHCFNCSTEIDPDNRKCNIDGHVFEETLSKLTCRRDENCPLHELPPHGDLLDRDKILFDAAEVCEGCGDYAVFGYSHEQIENAPVIIPADKEETE